MLMHIFQREIFLNYFLLVIFQMEVGGKKRRRINEVEFGGSLVVDEAAR
jgi:hypothetical protein